MIFRFLIILATLIPFLSFGEERIDIGLWSKINITKIKVKFIASDYYLINGNDTLLTLAENSSLTMEAKGGECVVKSTSFSKTFIDRNFVLSPVNEKAYLG